MIALTADKDKNRLDTGTLGWKDIDNKADFTAEHTGGSIGTGGPIGSQLITNAAGGLLSNANNSGHAEGTTQSAVSDGTVIVRNEDKQKQDISELNRDTEHANDGSINPIFDKEKEQNRLKQSQLIGEIGNQTMDIIRTEGEIAGYKAQKDPDALAVAKKQLEAAGKTPTEQAIKDQAYNNAMAQYGTGSDFQKAAQAVTGLLQGLAGDNLAGALANASSPYLATLIKQQVGEDNKAANAMAHAVLGAVVAELNNQSAAAGGLGAGGGELSAQVIMNTLFPGKQVWELSETEKQQVSALSQLAAGLAGGLTTGDVAGAVTAAQAGKNAVENNLLSNKFGVDKLDDKGKALYKKLEEAGIGNIDDLQAKYVGCNGNADCERNVRNEYRNQEKAAGEKLVGLYQSGQLSKEEFNYFVTEYTTAMLLGIEQGEKLSDTGFDWIGDIYRLSGSDWTVAGQINNPYFNEIRTTELIVEWKAQGLSDEKIQEKLQKDSTLGGLIAPVDVKNILNLVDNGASKEDLAKAATGIALGKVLQGKKGNNGSGKGSPIPVKDPVTASNGLDYQSNPKHTINPPRNAGIEPKNSLNLFENSVSVNAKNQKARYTMDDTGNIHQFMPDNTGKWHWAGSTADKRNPLILPNDVKSALKKQQGWKIK